MSLFAQMAVVTSLPGFAAGALCLLFATFLPGIAR
jgi:hypothetical protein